MHYLGSLLAAVSLSVAAPAIGLAAEAAPTVPAGIATVARGDGWWFVDAKGFVLYTFGRDQRTPGQSACIGDCAKDWPPFIAAADAKPVGNWSTIRRPDGTPQWTYKGLPLYFYASENGPGTNSGDGQSELWYVASEQIWTPAEIKIANMSLGRTLATTRGLTLYTFDNDQNGKSVCTKTCLRDWVPVEAPLAASDHQNWSPMKRDEGTRQWAYKGKPLYRHVGDAVETDTLGDGVDGKWHAAVLQPAEPYPAWVTVQGSDAGALLADSNGKTIYTYGFNRTSGRVKCGSEPCANTHWKPVLADEQAKGQNVWSVIKNNEGKPQWAYRGMKLYTYDLDQGPGDFLGMRFGEDWSWMTVMRSGLPLQGVTIGGG